MKPQFRNYIAKTRPYGVLLVWNFPGRAGTRIRIGLELGLGRFFSWVYYESN